MNYLQRDQDRWTLTTTHHSSLTFEEQFLEGKAAPEKVRARERPRVALPVDATPCFHHSD